MQFVVAYDDKVYIATAKYMKYGEVKKINR